MSVTTTLTQEAVWSKAGALAGRAARKRLAAASPHGSTYNWHMVVSLCMGVVKHDTMIPDWDWEAMQRGEKWEREHAAIHYTTFLLPTAEQEILNRLGVWLRKNLYRAVIRRYGPGVYRDFT